MYFCSELKLKLCDGVVSIQKCMSFINMSKYVVYHVFEVVLGVNMIQMRVNMHTQNHQSNVSAYF